MSIQITSTTRVTKDAGTGALRTWYDTASLPQPAKVFVPRTVARTALKDNADLFKWRPELSDLTDGALLKRAGAHSVRFTQQFKGVPVDASEVVVNMYDDSSVYSIYNNYHYDIPGSLDPKAIKLSGERARGLVHSIVREFKSSELGEPRLMVYQYHSGGDNHPPKGHTSRTSPRERIMAAITPATVAADIREGAYFLAWEVVVFNRNPTFKLRFLVDAMSERFVKVQDLAQYATGTGQVFDPNPIVTSGDLTLSSATATVTLDAQRKAVNMDRLDPPDGGGSLHLDGQFVDNEEFEAPTHAEPTSATGDFGFSYSDQNFLDAMTYYHLDRFQNYVQTDLGMNNVCNIKITVDPQGFGSADNSQYVAAGTSSVIGTTATKPTLTFGAGPNAGNPIPDAADAMVVLHEYGHAIQDNVNPGFNNPGDGTGEGFGDFLSAVYYDDKHAVPAKTRGIMMPWDANTTDHSWSGRRYDMNWVFGDANYALDSDNHYHGQFWCATMFELYRKLGGDSQYPSVKSNARDLAIRLHLMANFAVPAVNSSSSQMAQQVQAADGNLGGWRYANGLHKKVIYDTFRRRGLPTFTALPVDVYINDGRHGGYGSLTGTDLFTEKLFLDNYWSTQDLWVTVVPYATAADQQAGDPGDHVEPPVNSTAYLYVRVKNKGSTGSGSVTVKAYHSDPTIGLVWPADWTPTDTPSDTVADIPASGAHVFGPFPWTPTQVGHECVFAIAECNNDHAVTQDLLPTDVVSHADLVPFDNNIGQRNLYPTSAKAKMARGFWVSNPNFHRSVVKLHFESTFPAGWTYRTNIANNEAIHLAARERRWVEVTIDQATGPEIVDFTNPPQLTVSGSIDGKLIGGVSFYAAPPTAFPGRKDPTGPVTGHSMKPEDLFCLNIPWKDCEIEGEIDIKLKFRRGKDGK